MASAKQSRLEKLHAMFTETLISELKDGHIDPETGEKLPTPAATLSVIRSFLADAGIKPVNDSPVHQRLMDIALPFKSTDEQKAPH
jgi:hypothetical protein